jgi:hypothetical protein
MLYPPADEAVVERPNAEQAQRGGPNIHDCRGSDSDEGDARDLRHNPLPR